MEWLREATGNSLRAKSFVWSEREMDMSDKNSDYHIILLIK